MKPEYCNGNAIALDAENREITISFDFCYIDIAKDTTECNHTEVSKIVMSIEKAERLFESLKKCIDQYTDYANAKAGVPIGGEQNE